MNPLQIKEKLIKESYEAQEKDTEWNRTDHESFRNGVEAAISYIEFNEMEIYLKIKKQLEGHGSE